MRVPTDMQSDVSTLVSLGFIALTSRQWESVSHALHVTSMQHRRASGLRRLLDRGPGTYCRACTASVLNSLSQLSTILRWMGLVSSALKSHRNTVLPSRPRRQ